MSKSYSGLFSGTMGTSVNSTYLTESSDVESYAERGVDIPQYIKERLSKLQHKGDIIKGSIGEFTMADVSIMSRETGVEFAHVTIGNETFLIRGDGKSTDIPDELVKRMERGGGTWNFHSHPHNDDCIPSDGDIIALKKLSKYTGQRTSIIVTPNGRISTFGKDGIISIGTVPNTIDADRQRALLELFGGK